MNKFVILLLAATFIVAGTGCNALFNTEDDDKPEITGMIFAVEDDRILVVSGIEDVEIEYDQWEGSHRAIYFTVERNTEIRKGKEKLSPDQLMKGLKVQVWADGPLMESYPEQGGAKKIVILEE